MAKYMLRVNYTADGAKGLIKDGGSTRRAVAQKAAESVGGRVESSTSHLATPTLS